MLLNGMEWSGSNEWFTTKRGLWVNPNHYNGMPAGNAKSLKGLDFVVVYNSGHLGTCEVQSIYSRDRVGRCSSFLLSLMLPKIVPYNQPENALDLITRFIRNESFYDYPLPDFDFSHKTVNPGTSLANGMYPISSSPLKASPETHHHHGLWVFATIVISFVAGIFASAYWGSRTGYRQID